MKNNIVILILILIIIVGSGLVGCENTNKTQHPYDNESYKFASLLASSYYGRVFAGFAGGGGRIDVEVLASDIYKARRRFDVEYGGTGSYKVNAFMRGQWYFFLSDYLKDLKRNLDSPYGPFNKYSTSSRFLLGSFERVYGNLINSDYEGLPDVEDLNDDGDEYQDGGNWGDEDDDGDGVLDVDEPYGNPAGVTAVKEDE